MPRVIQKFFAGILLLTLIVPQTVWASAGAQRQPSVAFVPVIDGNLDERSKTLASDVAFSVGLSSNFHIVNSDLTAKVLKYYQNHGNEISPLQDDEKLIAAAKIDYFNVDFARARKKIDGALKSLREDGQILSATGPVIVDANLVLALVAKAQNDIAAVRSAMQEVLRIHPTHTLSETDFAPSVIKLFEEEKSAHDAKPRGGLHISTNPKAADVYINGFLMGATPLELSLPEDHYQIKINENRYGEILREMGVAAGKNTKLNEKLKWTNKPQPADNLISRDTLTQLKEGLRIAGILRVDKVVLVNADAKDARVDATLKVIDAPLKAGLPEIVFEIPGENTPRLLSDISKSVIRQLETDVALNPKKNIDPQGFVDSSALGKKKSKLTSNPWFWIILGSIAATGLGCGLAFGLEGDSLSPSSGSLRVEFR